MGRIEKTVFLSYRRTNAPWALAIFQDLTHHGYDVFFDFNGLASGDFESVIIENIRDRAHFIVLLTPSALERCGEPGDLLRREIETALGVKRNIVALTLDGFDFDAPSIASQLTGTLAALKNYNAISVSIEFFPAAMERLRTKFLNVALDMVLHPASAPAVRAAKVEQAAASSAPAVTKKDLTAQEWYERGFYATDLDEKLRFYDMAVDLQPDFAFAFNDRGAVLRTKGDWDGAIRDFNEAIRLSPGDAYAFHNRGLVHYDRGEINDALVDLNEAIRLKPDNAYSFFSRGQVRHVKGDLGGALLDLNEAIRLRPGYADCFVARGNLRRAKGDLRGALEDYDKAVRLQPGDANAYHNRGVVRHEMGDPDDALLDLNEAIRIRPNYANSFVARGNARNAIGDRGGALDDYNEAIRLDPDLAIAFNNRGTARFHGGDLKGALNDYNEAIRLKQDYAGAYLNRARVLQKQFKFCAAAADCGKYLNLGSGGKAGFKEKADFIIRALKGNL